METDRKWIVIRVDGKLAGISQDYDRLAEIAARIARECKTSGDDADSTDPKSRKTGMRWKKTERRKGLPYGEITVRAVTFEEIWELRANAAWEDLMLFGTDFQKRVWKTLWEHGNRKSPYGSEQTDAKSECTGSHFENTQDKRRLLSYTDFADLCGNRAGVRAIAHAVGLNPLPVIIPCHLIVPKEAIDRIQDIQHKAESTIFRGEDLCRSTILNDNAIDFGEYALGKGLKRRLISMDME